MMTTSEKATQKSMTSPRLSVHRIVGSSPASTADC
jgi:hypothetical protein